MTDASAIGFHPYVSSVDRGAFQLGRLTWEMEGNADPHSRFYSRRPHWPGGGSGVTIGRGFDLGLRSRADIETVLTHAGVPTIDVPQLSAAAGLRGQQAREFVVGRALPSISAHAEWSLFRYAYDEATARAARVLTKAGGSLDSLHPAMREVVIDMAYRGDLSERNRADIMPSIVANDLPKFAKILSLAPRWIEGAGVPRVRFAARRDLLMAALSRGW